jgi:hypothetical protein
MFSLAIWMRKTAPAFYIEQANPANEFSISIFSH